MNKSSIGLLGSQGALSLASFSSVPHGRPCCSCLGDGREDRALASVPNLGHGLCLSGQHQRAPTALRIIFWSWLSTVRYVQNSVRHLIHRLDASCVNPWSRVELSWVDWIVPYITISCECSVGCLGHHHSKMPMCSSTLLRIDLSWAFVDFLRSLLCLCR